MKNIYKTSIFTVTNILVFIGSALFIQIKNQNRLVEKCSYLVPVTIDVLAFIAASFLVVEGIYKIVENKDVTWQKQVTRSFRIAFGFSILTLHVLQVIYK